MVTTTSPCSGCGRPFDWAILAQAFDFAYWHRPDGACPACVQQELLTSLLSEGEELFQGTVQRTWPLDAEAAFGALPTPLRLHADPRYSGQGVTIAVADSGFTAHPDLIHPDNRIRAWVDATVDPPMAHRFGPNDTPRWPGSDQAADHQWHGTMTSVVAAGNGFLSHGLYRGLAWRSDLILLHLTGADGRIDDSSLLRALAWIADHRTEYQIRVASLSVAGDAAATAGVGPVDQAVEHLVDLGVTVVAAAGNDGHRRLIPPATAPRAITVGGLDDKNTVDAKDRALWHSNFGDSAAGIPKPELVAPSIWVAAPVLPGSAIATEARRLFDRRAKAGADVLDRIRELKLITPYYQHVDGTSFAAPIAAGTVAAMIEVNGSLTPRLIKEILIRAAEPVAGASPERQGAGALNAGRAVALAAVERHRWTGAPPTAPIATVTGPSFLVHDHRATSVEIFGSWNGWSAPVVAIARERGIRHRSRRPVVPNAGASRPSGGGDDRVFHSRPEGRAGKPPHGNPGRVSGTLVPAEPTRGR